MHFVYYVFRIQTISLQNALLCPGNKQLLCYNTARHPLSPFLSRRLPPSQRSRRKVSDRRQEQKKSCCTQAPARRKKKKREKKKQQPTATPASLALVTRTASLKSNQEQIGGALSTCLPGTPHVTDSSSRAGCRGPSAGVSSGSSRGTLTHLITSERAAFH